MAPTTGTWPEGVIARYLAVGTATVDVIDSTAPWDGGIGHSLSAACTGELCGWTGWAIGTNYWFGPDEDPNDDDGYYHAVGRLQQQAQEHAEKCRAMPRPKAGGR